MRSNLELFLLTLIRDGVGTPYELLSRADLSLGSTVPALARLERDGLVKASAVQARRSRRFRVTSKGLKTLKGEWREHLSTEPNDLDSILRISYLAWALGSTKEASSYLRRSSMRLATLTKVTEAEADRFGGLTLRPDYRLLRLLRTRIEARRLAASAKELLSIAGELESEKSGLRTTKKKRR